MVSEVENKINICIDLDLTEISYSDDLMKFYYQKMIKPLLSFLYPRPNFLLTLSLSGPEVLFLKNNYPEALDLLHDLQNRHQVEITGGGYWAPIFPLIFNVDKTGQIEKLTSLLHATVGKRPRGATLYGSIWEPGLVATLQSCGFEYLFLDSTLIPKKAQNLFLPLITSDLGKSIKVLPCYNSLLPAADESPEKWCKRINEKVKNKKNSIISLKFTGEKFMSFFKSDLFNFLANLDDSNDFALTSPQKYLKNAPDFFSVYIPAGVDWSIAEWANNEYVKSENNSHFSLTIYDYLETYPQLHLLFERMIYISMLLNQSKGDKICKINGREFLWKSQAGNNYISLPDGLPARNEIMQNAYQNLINSEKVIRDLSKMGESLTRFDYNYDGFNEYVFQMEKFSALLSLEGGAITSLDVMSSGYNYAANLSRNKSFDGEKDEYNRGIFIDHFFSRDEFENYKNFSGKITPVFSKIKFTERKFENKRNEVQLEGRGTVFAMKQPLLLRKKIIVSSAGFVVQYILKNDSPFALKGIFVVECNLNVPKKMTETNALDAEVIYNAARKTINTEKKFLVEDGISTIKLNDTKAKLSFIVEPNENSGYLYENISFKRPHADEKGNIKIENISSTAVNSFFWNVDLAAGMEMEKTINFSIIPEIKNKKKISDS